MRSTRGQRHAAYNNQGSGIYLSNEGYTAGEEGRYTTGGGYSRGGGYTTGGYSTGGGYSSEECWLDEYYTDLEALRGGSLLCPKGSLSSRAWQDTPGVPLNPPCRR